MYIWRICLIFNYYPFYSYRPKISVMVALERKMLQMNNLVTILFGGRGSNCSLGNMFRDNHTRLVEGLLMVSQCLWDIISKSFIRSYPNSQCLWVLDVFRVIDCKRVNVNKRLNVKKQTNLKLSHTTSQSETLTQFITIAL